MEAFDWLTKILIFRFLILIGCFILTEDFDWFSNAKSFLDDVCDDDRHALAPGLSNGERIEFSVLYIVDTAVHLANCYPTGNCVCRHWGRQSCTTMRRLISVVLGLD